MKSTLLQPASLDGVEIRNPVHLTASPQGDKNPLDVSVANSFLSGVLFDYMSVAYPNSTTEVFTYKTGGSGGSTVATITVVYTDSTKDSISSVAKS